jgi:transposase
MKALRISDAESMIPALHDEIRRCDQSRYDHRLHGVLLVAQGLSCPQVAAMLGDAPRTVENWVRRFEHDGFAGLAEGDRPGRPRRLDEKQMAVIGSALRKSPKQAGVGDEGVWDGKTLSSFVMKRFGVDLQVRQCQRLFRQLGWPMPIPRPRGHIKKLRGLARAGYDLWAVDEVHFQQHGPAAPCGFPRK